MNYLSKYLKQNTVFISLVLLSFSMFFFCFRNYTFSLLISCDYGQIFEFKYIFNFIAGLFLHPFMHYNECRLFFNMVMFAFFYIQIKEYLSGKETIHHLKFIILT